MVTISAKARRDLEELWLHIAAADLVIEHLEERFLTLALSPQLGRIRKDLWPDAYCFSTGKGNWRSHFLIFYRIGREGIEIARVLEGHRDIRPDWF